MQKIEVKTLNGSFSVLINKTILILGIYLNPAYLNRADFKRMKLKKGEGNKCPIETRSFYLSKIKLNLFMAKAIIYSNMNK